MEIPRSRVKDRWKFRAKGVFQKKVDFPGRTKEEGMGNFWKFWEGRFMVKSTGNSGVIKKLMT